MDRAAECRARVSPLQHRRMSPRYLILVVKAASTGPRSPPSILLPTGPQFLPLEPHLDIRYFRRVPLRSIPDPKHATHGIRYTTNPALPRAFNPLPDHPDVRAWPAMGWYRG